MPPQSAPINSPVVALNQFGQSLTSYGTAQEVNYRLANPVVNDTTVTTLEPLVAEAARIYGGSSASPVKPPNQQDSPPVHPVSRQTSRQTSRKPQTSDVEWSPSLQTLIDQPPSQLPARLILAAILFSCVFGAWAWFGRIQEVSYAQGRLVPEGEVYKIQPVTQGEIDQILVKEGETVEAGQIIAVLDYGLAQAEVDRLQQRLSSYQLQHDQIRRQIDQARLELQTRQAMADAAIQSQESAVKQARAQANTAYQTVDHLQAEASAYQTRLARLQPLVDEGALSQEQLFEVEQSVREYERMLIQRQGEQEGYLAEAEQLEAGLTQKWAEREQITLESQQTVQQLSREISQIEAEISETQTLLQAAEKQLEQMYLYAPVSGVVSSLGVQNIGEVAQPSQTIAEIAPEQAPLVLSAILPSREAGFVEEEMPVQIKFDAFPYQQHGIVEGRVTSISPDTKIDEQLGTVYEIEVALDPDTEIGLDVQLKAGQTATAEIVTRQRRVIDLLLDPIKKLQSGVNL